MIFLGVGFMYIGTLKTLNKSITQKISIIITSPLLSTLILKIP